VVKTGCVRSGRLRVPLYPVAYLGHYRYDERVQAERALIFTMPNVLRKAGFRVVIYFDDHLLSHVHMFYAEEEVKISLGSEREVPAILELRGKPRTGVKALEIAIQHQTELLEAWDQIHGKS
jgi:hypothetical protein